MSFIIEGIFQSFDKAGGPIMWLLYSIIGVPIIIIAVLLTTICLPVLAPAYWMHKGR